MTIDTWMGTLKSNLAAVSGIRQVHKYDELPGSIVTFPTIIIMPVSGDQTISAGGLNIAHHQVQVNLYLAAQVLPEAYYQAIPFINSIRAAIAADITLGNLAVHCLPVSPPEQWYTGPGALKYGDKDHVGIIFRLDVKEQESITVQAEPYDYYVDSVSGLDTNAGTSPGGPFQTIAKLLTVMAAGDTVGLKKGSEWGEKLIIPGAGCTVVAYGTGARPIIDCRDNIATADWTKSVGYTNIYQVTKTIDTGLTDPFIHVWVDGEMLTNVASLAACDAAAGSYYVAAHNASPVTIYVHSTGSTNPASDSKVYKYNPRYSSLYAQLLDNQTVTGIHTIGNLAGAGSLVVGKNSVVTDCYIEDGGKHNSVAGSGTSFTDCTFDGGHMGNNVGVLLTINSDTPANEGAILTRCTFTLPSITVPHWAYLLAISSHYNVSGSFGTITLTDCIFENFSGTTSTFNHAAAVNIVNPTFTNCKFGFFPPQTVCDMTVTGGSWTSTITNQRMMDASYANAGTLTIDGMTINANGTTDTGYVSVRAACVVVVKNCIFKANINGTGGAPIYCSSAGANLTIGGSGQGNTFNTGTGYWGYNLYFAAGAAGMTWAADYNSYEATNDQWSILGTLYTTLATYQAAVSPNDANSTST